MEGMQSAVVVESPPMNTLEVVKPEKETESVVADDSEITAAETPSSDTEPLTDEAQSEDASDDPSPAAEIVPAVPALLHPSDMTSADVIEKAKEDCDDDDDEPDQSFSEELGAEEPSIQPGETKRGLKVLFLSSDTGGGHRASAESLGKQFELLFPGSTFSLADIISDHCGPPLNNISKAYKHLAKNPTQWKLLYNVTNSKAFGLLWDAPLKMLVERTIRKRLKKLNPDVVVSVHPMMTNVPILACEKLSKETGRHWPIFTVVTDLGSAHGLWFASGVEKLFVGSEQIRDLANKYGKLPPESMELIGLPIRHDFGVQAEKLGKRFSLEGQAYQLAVREELELPYTDRKTLLVMGGGDGVGSLGRIVDALYGEIVSQGIDALILVVCGRNEQLKKSLEERDWNEVFRASQWIREHGKTTPNPSSSFDACNTPGCMESNTGVTGSIRRMLSSGALSVGSVVSAPHPESLTMGEEKKMEELETTSGSDEIPDIHPTHSLEGKTPGRVHVHGLGFVTRMAEYMVASDILVTKAGPGTISEAAALSLPVMLTSFLPGQEEGNVDFVIDGAFGAYVHDSDPVGIAEEVCMWLTDDERREKMSDAAKSKGAPNAARDIAQMIGDSTLKWRELNEQRAAER